MQVPKVMLLGGETLHSLRIAAEVKRDTGASITGIGKSRESRLLRSRYCSTIDTLSESERKNRTALLTLIDRYEPDVVIPTGYEETELLVEYRESVRQLTNVCLPPRQSFETAVSKQQVYEIAADADIDTPTDFTQLVTDNSPETIAEKLEYPLFLKASKETGGNVTAKVKSSDSFCEKYYEIDAQIDDGEVLVQEYIEGENHTYGFCFLFDHGEPVLSFAHKELRSVPREGGSGTRVRSYHDDSLTTASIRLLRRLDWHGIAMVEYVKRRDGSFVLMEINPKFWASYALASQCGYRFASHLIELTLDKSFRIEPMVKKKNMEMVFPLREFNHYLLNRDEESFLECTSAMFWPSASWDIDFRDLRAWLTLPRRFSS
ncbi:carboxylate--amine ligase [Natrarchaeobius oligotrophus]|uniref:ATP-grasp domain-containing protein n=1 Tax=Natrarchaeobius chitinivorans TaxID=1679083 RepID=A0A3N6MH55_NATCH|nr:ATP-grasp domain-containing protein [Natrarchaeobius chitinivorans]RQG96180.1 ATP-grasp domain-containing protein [Natrarchaeobius chitinivorans]